MVMPRDNRWSQKRTAGFTLVELLVVISIIGILARLLFVNFAEVRVRGRDSRRKSDLAQVKNALRLYYNDYQTYPGDNASNQIVGCGAAGDQACPWGEAFAAAGTTYMAQLPLDPININPHQYAYVQTGAGDGFILQVRLETDSDDSAVESQQRCGVDPDNTVAGIFMVCTE